MKARGILYRPDMIRAKLEGRKTQTRRIVKPQPEGKISYAQVAKEDGAFGITHNHRYEGELLNCDFIKCPYGKVGDVLYAKETWRWFDAMIESDQDGVYSGYQYRADIPKEHDDSIKWKSPLFMPRIAARIIDEITEIRVERLQDISAEDVIVEGVAYIAHCNGGGDAAEFVSKAALKWAYRDLWISINSQELWDSNPWVWVITTNNLSLTGWDGIKTPYI